MAISNIRVLPVVPIFIALASSVFAQEAPARLIAAQEAVISSESAGTVLEMPFEEGEAFAEGDLLLSFDCRAQISEQKMAAFELRAMELDFAAKSSLFSRGGLGRTEFKISEALLEAEKQRVATLSLAVEDCQVVAPFDGTIVKNFANPFETIGPASELVHVVSNQLPEVEIIAPSKWLSWIEIGLEGRLTLSELDREVAIKIVALNPVVDPVSRTTSIRARIEDGFENILPGMSGRAAFSRSGGVVSRQVD